ncbi:T9SS type B sorting domain-containing protein [Parasediminibacterium sp. JCM 36343]|uniref:T9SS type B sorting domain-containing protein n=1 Tax=Parasediminibacterium sp. JCM 36343 TaxID=3374279 RepID=UPI00397DD450
MSSKTKMDPYGNFPVVCPFGGNYSVKLGNENNGSEAEGISYTFTVPSTVDTFTFTYFYSVVFQDPGHALYEQPRFFVSAYEVATGNIINCAAFNYVSTSTLPGFYHSKTNDGVLYKNWTPVSLQFAGLMGKEVRLEFKNADCTLGGHFGYSYLDVASGCTNILATAPYCIQTNSLTLNAPYGFQYYTWYNNNYTQVMGNTQTLTLSPPPVNTGSFWVDVIPYPGFGCRDTFEAKVHPLSIPPLPSCSSDFYFCKNQQNATVDAVADSGNVFVWYANDTTTTVGSEYPPVINTSVAGDFIYYVAQKQLFGCEGFHKKVVVHVVGFSNSSITVNSVSQCLSANRFDFTSTASSNINITYRWQFGDGDTLLTQLDSTVSHNYNRAGTFYVVLRANYFNKCISFQNIPVNVVPAPIADFRYNAPVCENQTAINFQDNSYVTSYTSNIKSWIWNINGQFSFNRIPLSYIPANDSPITVKLIVKTTEGCPSDTTTKVIAVQHKPKAFFSFPSILCSSETIAFSDKSFFDANVNNEKVIKWNWAINNKNINTANNIQFAFDTGFNKISLNVESNYGCKSKVYDTTIYINRKPFLSVSLNDSCINKIIQYTAIDSFKVANSWYWNFNTSYYSAPNIVTKIFYNPDDHPFSIIAKTVKQCSDTIDRYFHIYDNIAFAGYDTLVANAQPVYLNANGYAGTTYSWQPSTGLNKDGVENPIATYDHDVQYKLHSVTKEGCERDSKILIKRWAGPALYVATAFTPNNDGLNDVLHVFPVGIKLFEHFSIYNRLGNLVFTTTDVSKGWDGRYKGVMLENETFVAVAEAIDYNGNPLMYKGTVMLIR